MKGRTMSDRYTVISADCHAGATVAAYRDYLEEEWLEEFDAWRGRYANPFSDLKGDGRSRNWDTDRRNADQETDGVVAEVVFPNTVPPFFPTGQLIAPPPNPNNYQRRLAGIRAHNRWVADFCAEQPTRRAGIGQIFLNDIEEAVCDVRWIAANGLRGGILLPGVPDDAKHIEPLYSREYDRLWAVCEELGVVVNHHAGGGTPDYGKHDIGWILFALETPYYSRRALTHMVMSGVFQRFPGLKMVLTETSAAWSVQAVTTMNDFHRQMCLGRIGEISVPGTVVLAKEPGEYVHRNVWFGASFPSRSEIEARHEIGVDRILWGSDYPHHESTFPYTTEGLQLAFHGVPTEEVTAMLSGNAARVYGFDVAALTPLAQKYGPRVEVVAQPLAAIPEGVTSPAFFRK